MDLQKAPYWFMYIHFSFLCLLPLMLFFWFFTKYLVWPLEIFANDAGYAPAHGEPKLWCSVSLPGRVIRITEEEPYIIRVINRQTVRRKILNCTS